MLAAVKRTVQAHLVNSLRVIEQKKCVVELLDLHAVFLFILVTKQLDVSRGTKSLDFHKQLG